MDHSVSSGWTPEDDALLRALWGGEGSLEGLALSLSRSTFAVRRRAKELGLGRRSVARSQARQEAHATELRPASTSRWFDFGAAPMVIKEYRDGEPLSLICERYGLSRSELTALLRAWGVPRTRGIGRPRKKAQ